MSGTGEYGPLRMRSLSVPSDDLHGDDGHLIYLCSPLEQAVLQQLHNELIWMLPGPELAPHLYAKGLITRYEYEQFVAKTTLTDKNQHLLISLSRRPEGVLESLLSWLDDNDDISAAKEIAKSLREKLEDVKLEFSQVGSVAPLQAEAQTVQASPGPMIPNVVFEYLRDENKKLKQENEALRNESETLRHRATMLEAKLKRFKKKVRRKLKVAVESSDDEDTDDESRSHSTENVKSLALMHPQQESKNGFNAASDFAYAIFSRSSHMPVISEEDHAPIHTGGVVQQPHSYQSGRRRKRYYSVPSQTSFHDYMERQNRFPVQKRHCSIPSQQNASLLADEPDTGNRTPETEKTEPSQMTTRLGGRDSSQHMCGQNETAVDESNFQEARKQAELKLGAQNEITEKSQPPPKTAALKSETAQNKTDGQTLQTSSSSIAILVGFS